MTKIVVIQHVPYEILGTMNPLFKQHGIRIKYVNFGRHPDAQPCLTRHDALVILGGPMSVNDVHLHPHLETELALIQSAMSLGIPILGICLGAQLIAKATGAHVKKNPEPEIGWYDVQLTPEGVNDPLLSHFDPCEKIFQWHGDTFDLPSNSVHLAQSTTCANQAFRLGDNIYGLQFHLEVDQPLIERWLTVPRHQVELAKLNPETGPQVIRLQTQRYIQRTQHLSQNVFNTFSELILGHNKKTTRQFESR